MKRASLDIGSNTVRLLIAQKSAKHWERLELGHQVTRLSGHFDGSLQAEAIDRTVGAIAKFSAAAKEAKVDSIRAACTGVTRRASNTDEFLARAKAEAGIEVQVIPGKTEARLTAIGAVEMTGIRDESFLLFDIGGFSTELAWIENGAPVDLISLELGVVGLTENYLADRLPTSEGLSAVRGTIDEFIREQAERKGPATKIVGTAGTVTTLAAMAQDLTEYDPASVEGYVLARETILHIYRSTCAMTSSERLAKYPALEPGREDVILAGCLICLAVMDRFGPDRILATEGGLLEGLVAVENPL
jgi:exopolyphosphatase / guanosine-5'-triphosphate,3'-diphosphate pyrophosphatase